MARMLRHPHGAYTPVSIGEIVRAYWRHAGAAGLDPAMVLAQCIHETGNLTSWWAARPRRNPAGIGVTGRMSPAKPAAGIWAQRDGIWVEGVSFESWADHSIPAHVGRLLAYALPAGQGTAVQRDYIARALSVRPLPAHFRGVATTWQGLNGRWAVPGRDYDLKIVRIADAIRKEDIDG